MPAFSNNLFLAGNSSILDLLGAFQLVCCHWKTALDTHGMF